MVRYESVLWVPRSAWYLAACVVGIWLCAGDLLAQRAVSTPPGAASVAAHAATTAITGVVRNSESDEPLAGVAIQVVGGVQRTTTGGDGRYIIDALSPGVHTLLFIRESYQPLTLLVTVSNVVASIVDVGLVALPQVLPQVRVVASTPRVHTSSGADARSAYVVHDADASGGTTWSAEAIRGSPQLAQSDVLRAVETAATVATRSEAPSSIHVAGGSADQNLIMLDGIPIENAVHAGDLTSAIDPSAISSVTLYDARMPASLGGRLASAIAISTRGGLPDTRDPSDRHTTVLESLSLSAIAGTAGLGARIMGFSPGLDASGLLSVRHSAGGLGGAWVANPQAGQAAGSTWSDVLARGSKRIGGGELTVLGFATSDAVRFDARGGAVADGSDAPSVGGAPDGQGLDRGRPAGGRGFFADSFNGFAWRSSAVGITWRRPLSSATRLEVRAWRSATATSGAWGVGTGRATMSNQLLQDGALAAVTRATPSTWVNAGLSLGNVRTAYTIEKSGAGSSGTGLLASRPGLSLKGGPRLASAFVDTRLRMNRWATAFVGLRATSLLSPEYGVAGDGSAKPSSGVAAALHIEPRLGLTLSAGSRVTLETAYSRTEQHIQSLRNEESLFDNVIGINLFAATGNGIPTATSDLASVRATLTLSPTITVASGAYARRLQHVLLAAVNAAAPFATDTFYVGDGYGRGWYITAQRATEHFSLDASLATTGISRRSNGTRYNPGFAAARSVSVGMTVRPLARTTFRAAGVASYGRNAALTVGDFTWDWQGGASGSRSLQGSPSTVLTDRNRLPPYLRLDLGMRHGVVLGRRGACDQPASDASGASGSDGSRRAALPCGESTLTIFASVNNVFNHLNTAGYVRSITASPTATNLALMPRSLVAGLEWRW